MLRKRAAYCWLTGASRTECERSRGVIRLGCVDMESSFHLCGQFGCSSPHGTGDVSQFALFPQPCPTTSRPRDIPAGNIRQQQTDSSHRISLGKSLRGCGAAISEELTQADSTSLICLSGRHLDASLPNNDFAFPARATPPRNHPTLSWPSLPVAFAKQSFSEENLTETGLAKRRTLRGRDTIFRCYSSQEYDADEKLLDTAIESAYVCGTSSEFGCFRRRRCHHLGSKSI